MTQTPSYQRFLESGATLFEQAHVLHTQCSPSRATFITGRYMHVLGHRTQTHLVRSYEDNWLKYLKDAGYYVLWLGKNDMLAADSFPLSVTEWHNDIGVDTGSNAFQFGEAGYYSFLFDGGSNPANSSAHNGDYNAVVQAVEFMQTRALEPFFIWIPGMGAHPPYGAPEPYQSMYSPAEIEQKSPLRPPYNPGKPAYHSKTLGIPFYRNLTTLPASTFYNINAVYLGRVSYSDWIFGQLLDGIDAANMTDRTVVVMSSDHGDYSGSYNLVEKWPGGLDDVLTRVPLMMRVPGAPAGRTVAPPVSSMDAWATIMDLAGVNATHVHFANSLRKAIFGEPNAYPAPDNVVWSEGGFFYNDEIEPNSPSQHGIVNDPKNLYYARFIEELSNYPDGSPRAVMVRNSTHKLVWRPRGISELYEFSSDPRELANRWNDPALASVQQAMLTQLLVWYTQTADVTPINEDPRGSPPYSSCVPPDQAASAYRAVGGNVIPINVPAMVPCDPDVSPSMWRSWTLNADGTVGATGVSNSRVASVDGAETGSLCLLAIAPAKAGEGGNVSLAACDASNADQVFSFDLPTGHLVNKGTDLCLDANAGPSFGALPNMYPCDEPTWRGLVWSVVRLSADVGAPVQLQSAEDAEQMCLGVCASYDEGQSAAMSSFGVTV